MNTLEEWTKAVCAELGISHEVLRDVVLDMTKDVAHGVARPAAPLTSYLIGLAAGRADDPPQATRELSARVSELARQWAADHGSNDG